MRSNQGRSDHGISLMNNQMSQHEGYLAGQLLIAMPGMLDTRFLKSVIFMCSHDENGAMGLIINQIIESVNFSDLLAAMKIETSHIKPGKQVHFGGPVEAERGFVLHSTDFNCDETMRIKGNVSLTATVDILRLIASGAGPKNSLFALGYAGWGPGQLDAEIQRNGWIFGAADSEILFGNNYSEKWTLAASKVGIDLTVLSSKAGTA